MKQALLALCMLVFIKTNAQQIAKSLTATNGKKIGFYEYKPTDYDVDQTHKYPVIIFFHGIGERGNGTTDLPKVKANGIPKYIDHGHKMRFFWNGKWETFLVLSPQLDRIYSVWPTFYAEEMVKYAKQHLRCDTNRIVLAGLSLGGGEVWRYPGEKLANAKSLAAIAPSCGIKVWVDFCNIAKANLPVWAFHAIDDPTVNVSATNSAIAAINACNPAVIPYKTLWPTGGHAIWDRAFDTVHKWQNPNVYEWLLAQNKSLPVNVRPIAVAGSDLSISGTNGSATLSGAASSDPDGTLLRYIWRMISGPAPAVISNPVSEDGKTSVSGLTTAGVYQFELKAVDDRADYTLDTINISVVNGVSPNQPPVALAGPDIVSSATRATLKGSNSYDPDGVVVAYKWSKISGPGSSSISDVTSANPDVFNLSTGTYSFALETTDNAGAKSRDTVSVMETTFLLEVKLLDFSGKTEGNSNSLKWTAENESAGDYYRVERSKDGKIFFPIGNVKGHGNAEKQAVYSFTDDDPDASTCYYRLKAISTSGEYKYSAIISIKSTAIAAEKIACFPVPAHDQVVVRMEGKDGGSYYINVYSTAGKLLAAYHGISRQVTEKSIPLNMLTNGMYLLEVQIGNEKPVLKKIIKQ